MFLKKKVLAVATVLSASMLFLTACSDSSSELEGVSVEGAFGTKPVLSFEGDPSKDLKSSVVVEGTGEAIEDGDFVVVDYLEQVYSGDTFQNSFDSFDPITFTMGKQEIVPGWEKSLIDVKEGSRIVISSPPSEAYGSDGNLAAGFAEDATVVSVVDVLKVLDKDAKGQADAVVENEPREGVTITGDLGEATTVTIDPASPMPTEDKLTVLARGTGEPVERGLVLAQFTPGNWAQTLSEGTWVSGGASTIPTGTTDTVLDELVGLPLGSRVMIEYTPGASETPEEDAVIVVVDVIDQAFVLTQERMDNVNKVIEDFESSQLDDSAVVPQDGILKPSLSSK